MDRPLIEWPRPLFEFLEFVGVMLAAGAVGFRFFVSGPARRRSAAPALDAELYDRADRRAAIIGLAGSALTVQHLARALPGIAERQHQTLSQVMLMPPTALWVILTALAVIGFVLAARRSGIGWALAGVGVVAGTLRGLLLGRFSQSVKPAHLLGAGRWIGTLFVLVAAGIAVALGRHAARERRGAMVADMVRGFSPLALTMGGAVAGLGVVLALRELKPFSALWTTPYGYALIAKLSVVAVVFGLGAWNWRRQKPRLGTEEGALALRGSATGELVAALVVVLITAILASLPAPDAH